MEGGEVNEGVEGAELVTCGWFLRLHDGYVGIHYTILSTFVC